MRSVFIVAICLILYRGTAFAQTQVVDKEHLTKKELWAINKIAALREVKAFMHYAAKNQPELMFYGDPKPGYPYYWIKMGIGNFDQFRTTTNYYVNAVTGKIYLWDIMNEDDPFRMISLERSRTDPRVHKPHIFKNGKLIIVKAHVKE